MTHEELCGLAAQVVADPPAGHLVGSYAHLLVTLAKGYLALSAKLQEAEQALQEVQAERDALREKLEEAAAEIETLRVWQQEVSALMVAEKASHGEIVKACPACGAHEPTGQDRAWIVTGRPMLVCPRCRHQFIEPAFWQRVSRPAKTTA